MSIWTDKGVVMLDVVICGAGPTGLLLAAELALAGVRPLILEKRPEGSVIPRANGLIGQPIRLLRLRGLLARFSDGRYAGPVPSYPFGDVPMDLSLIPDTQLPGLLIPQPALEQLLAERAVELGSTVRRGHEVVGLSQDADGVTLEVRGPAGSYELACRYVVGCDGGRSVVRSLAGIGFPGSVDPEVLRMGHFKMSGAAGRYPNGGLEVPGFGRLERGWNRTSRGAVLGMSLQPGVLIAGVREPGESTDSTPLTLAELQASARRVLGGDLPLGEPIWLSRVVAQGRLVDRYRSGRIFLAGDAAHLFPAGGALTVGLPDAVNLGWKLAFALRGGPDVLDTYELERRPVASRALLQTRAQAALSQVSGPHGEALRSLMAELLTYAPPLRHLARLMDGSDTRYPTITCDHPLAGQFVPDSALDSLQAKPVLISDLPADGYDVDVQPPRTESMLVRPDGYVAWAGTDPTTLAAALTRWCRPQPR